MSALALVPVLLQLVSSPTPKTFMAPDRTAYRPVGCRRVPYDDPVLGPREFWRNLHADALNSDEYGLSLAPVMTPAWVAEAGTLNVTGPVFDAAGNLYFSPTFPDEKVILVSVDAATGQRRFAIPGRGAGGATPLVLQDPAQLGREVVYVGTYDRLIAVETDGTIVWDVTTGLVPTANLGNAVLGLNFHPGADAIVGLTANGLIYAHDRTTGAPLLTPVHSLPGSPSPPSMAGSIPPAIAAAWLAEMDALMDVPPNLDPVAFLDLILGGSIEVANHFSLDPTTGRLWVAATAPDGADGTLDGISELGALYGLDLVNGGGGWQIVEACHQYFTGGSASTPAVRADGTRIYVGDAVGHLLAIDDQCQTAWSLDIGAPLVGSVGVASDGDEVFAATATEIVKVIDGGTSATIAWRTAPEGYDVPAGQQNFNLDLYSIASDGIGFHAGAGPVIPGRMGFPLKAGVGVLDRATGAIRYFTDGIEETVAAMSTGPDGAIYLGQSPVRTAFARVLYPTLSPPPLVGGVAKYEPRRWDLAIRDGACAAADRASNAVDVASSCPASAAADERQILALCFQVQRSSTPALAAGDLTPARWNVINLLLLTAEGELLNGNLSGAAPLLRGACHESDLAAEPVAVGLGEGPLNPSRVRVLDTSGLPGSVDFVAYGVPGYGVELAAGSLDGPPRDRIVTGPGPGAPFGSHVRAFDHDGTPLSRVSFFAYATVGSGVRVATGEVDADGYAEILTGPGPGGAFGPHVRAFDVDGGNVVARPGVNLFAFSTLRYGAHVATADLERDGFDELLAAPGPGPTLGPAARGFDVDGAVASPIGRVDFFAFPATGYGLEVSGADVDGDGTGEIVCSHGAGPAHAARFVGFQDGGIGIRPTPGFDVTLPGTTGYGGRPAETDRDGDGWAELLAARGADPGADARVHPFTYDGAILTPDSPWDPFPGSVYGASIAGGRLAP